MIGGAGTPIWAGDIVDKDPNTRVRGNWLDSQTGKWGTARNMMLDPYVQQGRAGITDAIYAADHDFAPADDTPLAAEVADFCRHAFLERLDWESALTGILHYFRDGCSLIELTDDVRSVAPDRFPNHPQPKAARLYTGFRHRYVGSIDRWNQSKREPEKLVSVRQYVQGSDAEETGYVTIPSRRLLRFTWEQESANFLGVAPLRVVYGPWFRKVTLCAIAMIAHERHHVGVPTVILDELANVPEDEIEKIKTTLLELRAHQKSFLIFDKIKSFDFKSADGGTDIGQDIKDANFEITHGFSGGWTLLGSSGGNGSYALAGTQQGRTHVVTDRHVQFIDSKFNYGADGWSPVERLCVLNYGPNAPIPRKVTRNVPTVDYLKIVDALPKLKSAGFIKGTLKDENQIRRWMLMHERSESDEVIETAAAPMPVPPQQSNEVVQEDGQEEGAQE